MRISKTCSAGFVALGLVACASPVTVPSFLEAAQSCRSVEDWACTASAANTAAEHAGALGQYDDLWKAQALVAEAALRQGDKPQAIAAFKAAQTAANASSGTLSLDMPPQPSGITKPEITQQLVALLLEQSDFATAFESAEYGRARGFVDLLTDTELAFNDNKATNQKIRALDKNIVGLRVQMAMAKGAALKALEASSSRLLAQRQSLLDTMAQTNPEWAAAYLPKAAKLAEVQAAMGPSELLAYALPQTNPHDVQWLLITQNNVTRLLLPEAAKKLHRRFENLGDAIALKQPKQQAEVLEAMRIELGVNSWPSATQIYVVPEGLLHWAPWAGILPGQPLTVLPNASWLARKPTPALSNADGKALVVGDPAFGGQLSQLPGARQEALQIAALYSTDPLLGRRAQKNEILTRGLTRESVLHLATHGFFRADAPLQSALYLTNDKGLATSVTAQEIFENPLRAHTVVLSACETGLGQALPDNDVMGLQRSFLLNGAQAVISSLWAVEDAGVANMMTMFHEIRSEQIQQSDTKRSNESVALAMTVSKAKAQGLPPATYAAFVVTGHVPVRQ